MELVTLERIESLLKELNETMCRIDQRGEEQFKRGVTLDQKWSSLVDSAGALIPSVITYLTQNVKVTQVPWDDPNWQRAKHPDEEDPS